MSTSIGPHQHCAYSRPASGRLGDLVRAEYALSRASTCRFFVSNLHDNFLVEDQGRRYIARVYRRDWRSEPEILFELTTLRFLRERDCPVAAPVPTTGGALSITLACPEGERHVALFDFAPGRAPGLDLDAGQSRALGRAVAVTHEAADGFTPAHRRSTLTLDYLLDASLDAIAPYLTADERAALAAVQSELHARLASLPTTAPYFGICSGDVNPGNCHVTDDGRLTLFDFDQCGYGWRAFEIGKFFASIARRDTAAALRTAFLEGYASVRALENWEMEAIPAFVPVARIWVMAIHAYNAHHIGHKLLDRQFWARRVAAVKQLAGV